MNKKLIKKIKTKINGWLWINESVYGILLIWFVIGLVISGLYMGNFPILASDLGKEIHCAIEIFFISGYIITIIIGVFWIPEKIERFQMEVARNDRQGIIALLNFTQVMLHSEEEVKIIKWRS